MSGFGQSAEAGSRAAEVGPIPDPRLLFQRRPLCEPAAFATKRVFDTISRSGTTKRVIASTSVPSAPSSQVAVFDEGRELEPDEARKALAERMRQMRLESCLRALERLAAVEANNILSNALAYYQLHKSLTPKFANVVFWRLHANAIDHDPALFKVRLDKASYVSDLGAMPLRNVHRIWKALTSAQRKKAIELGHSAPPE